MRLIYLAFLLLFHLSCSTEQEEAASGTIIKSSSNTKSQTYKSGEAISLSFKVTDEAEFKLMLSNAFGSSLVLPVDQNKDHILFNVPQNYCKKSGLCHWSLIANGNKIEDGCFKIQPDTSSNITLETYFGPRSITAGDEDYSMLVNVTTDPFDNVFPEGTEVVFKSQFLNSIAAYTIPSKDMISWKNIYATRKSGRILVNTSFKDITSKELTTIVFPTLAESFLIEVYRNHRFADGNQIMKLSSNIIRDQYDNIISDGTMVNFVIENAEGAILKTAAPTINGIAKANILHPSEKDSWKIRAYVTGAASSNTLTIDFDTAISDFLVDFSDDNRIISVGPIRSFMQQLVPDGILIQADIYDDCGSYLQTKKLSSVKGYGKIELPVEYFDQGNYEIRIKVAGITKEFDIELDEK